MMITIQLFGIILPYTDMVSQKQTAAIEWSTPESEEQEDALEKISYNEMTDVYLHVSHTSSLHLFDLLPGSYLLVKFPIAVFQEIQSPPPDLSCIG